ncbi:hypothetical protein DSO57_1007569 [Entomophthora muscae]|uniref:Uncharacterized protein n=1 Tax=Entomophthora muscae TaxID=34485 RepID=A0ACC2S9C1_9FUNG|nr:hypothetical protein DSO57_1007569 [Entomophthora muscae]
MLGFAYYTSYLEVLTTILHHPVYMCMLVYALHKGYTTYFCIMLPMELPTLVLSVRILEPRLRNDAVHGIVFFATRILYHIYMIATWALQAESPTHLILAALFPFHVFCFHHFLKRQKSRYARLPKPLARE